MNSILMVLGVAAVFLCLMIIVGKVRGKTAQKSGTREDAAAGGSSVSAAAAGSSRAVTAAIVAAVNEYRKNET
ncbi:MAG: sodium pump decarboxylase subunit gamma [Treponema sp.]|nr:sodium pump decarboxylase subunit gamma [Treponema sp.]